MFNSPQSNRWRTAYQNHPLFGHNDFHASLVREITGDATSNVGASGDRSVVADRNYEFPLAKNLLQQFQLFLIYGARKIWGVQVANTKPTNRQVLTFETAQNAYVPMTPSTGSGNACILAGNQAYVNGSQPSFTLGVGGVLDIALSGSSGGVEGTIGSNNASIAMPYAGTAKNMTMNATVNGPAGTTYTLTLYSTAHGNTPVTSSVTVPSSGPNLVTFTDTTHSYAFAAFEQGFYKLTHNAATSVTILLQGYSLEYDHA